MLRIAVTLLAIAGSAGAEPARDVLQLANQYRAQKGLTSLTVSPALEAAAEAHGRDMARNGFFSHQGSNGSQIDQRVKRRGYRYCVIAENIAKGQHDPRQVLQAWMSSRGHRRNLLNRKAREAGVTRTNGDIWVMVIGTRAGGC